MTRLALIAVCVAAAFPAASVADAASGSGCLAAKGPKPAARSVRGLRVGTHVVMRDSSGKPMKVKSVRYCIDGGGTFSFALSSDSDVVLALSTADGDAVGPINPTSPALSARMAFPTMWRLTTVGQTVIYRPYRRSQLILGVASGRVTFVAAADRLLLDYPKQRSLYLKRLGV